MVTSYIHLFAKNVNEMSSRYIQVEISPLESVELTYYCIIWPRVLGAAQKSVKLWSTESAH